MSKFEKNKSIPIQQQKLSIPKHKGGFTIHQRAASMNPINQKARSVQKGSALSAFNPDSTQDNSNYAVGAKPMKLQGNSSGMGMIIRGPTMNQTTTNLVISGPRGQFDKRPTTTVQGAKARQRLATATDLSHMRMDTDVKTA